MVNKFVSTDLDVADIRTQKEELSFIKRLIPEDLKDSLDYPVTICYTLIDIDKTKYGFGQLFEHDDTVQYFKVMKKFATNTLNQLFEDRQNYHLYRSPVKGNLLRVLKEIYPDLVSDTTPEIYHFALYTANEGNADRKTGTRSPRIYFVLSDGGHVYPLFFDPFHELNP